MTDIKIDTHPFLSDLEKERVGAFWDDATLREAVRKCIVSWIHEQGTLKKGEKFNYKDNFALAFVSTNQEMSDSEIGQQIRAMFHGTRMVETAFSSMANLSKADSVGDGKPTKGLTDKDNPR